LILVSRRTKIMVGVWVLLLCASGAAVVFHKEIRIAYHRNRMFAAMENHGLITGQTRMATAFENLSFWLLNTSSAKESETMEQHQTALIELGHLEKRSSAS